MTGRSTATSSWVMNKGFALWAWWLDQQAHTSDASSGWSQAAGSVVLTSSSMIQMHRPFNLEAKSMPTRAAKPFSSRRNSLLETLQLIYLISKHANAAEMLYG